MSRRGLPTGVQRKHSRACPAHADKTARCRGKGCSYQVQAGPRGARQTKTVPTLDEAVAWKRDVDGARAAGKLTGSRAPTLREASALFLRDARAGVALARGQRAYRTGTLDAYARYLEVDVLPSLGTRRLDQIRREDLNAFAQSVSRRGLGASSVRNMLMPVRAVFRHAMDVGWIRDNPTLSMKVPSPRPKRLRVAEPHRVAAYIEALPVKDRALWATAFYGGLRRGELMALKWSDVDMAAGVITIDPDRGGYNPKTLELNGPKSEAGGRRIPISGALREALLDHRSRAGARPAGFAFARGTLETRLKAKATEPFDGCSVPNRAKRAFIAAGLPPLTLHECRHTFASLMIAAMGAKGVFNPKLLQQIMGHSSIQMTYDRYGHLFPGGEAEVGVMLDDLLSPGVAVVDEASTAWSRTLTLIDATPAEDARPVVTQVLADLASWQREHPPGRLIASRRKHPAHVAERPASVQRTGSEDDPR